MKKLLVIIFVTILGSVLFSECINITQNNDKIIFGNQNSIFIDNNENIYLTYGKRINQEKFLLYFAYYQHNSNQFTETFIDTLYNYAFIKEKTAPVLIVTQGNISVFYNKSMLPSDFEIWKATSTDNGNTFSRTFLDDNVFMLPSVFKNDNNNLVLSYIRGKKKFLSKYQYYSDFESSENQTLLYFNQQDSFNGSIFSNDNIFIMANNTYPSFNSLVSTSKNFTVSGDISFNQLFPQGYLSNVPQENYSLSEDIDSYMPFAGFDADIVYVNIQGTHYTSKLGKIQEIGMENFPVYAWYPQNAEQAQEAYANGYNWLDPQNILYVNQVMLYDTTWVDGPEENIENNSKIFTEKTLWIKGNISGKQLWISSENVYLVGDITYQDTPVGNAPDEMENINQNDYFGLISLKKIIIKYKYKDPMNNFTINDDNCNGINLYGAYCAIQKADSTQYNDQTSHFDGMFTFEYQHPHGSTPDFIGISPYTGEDTLYTFIDLHKFIYPPDFSLPGDLYQYNVHGGIPVGPYAMCGYPYENPEYLPNSNIPPYGTDYPWYNPVWPESAEEIVTERGIINLFGAIYQARKGFIHRSGVDQYNHPSGENFWHLDDENFIYATTHPSTGYGKNYHYDTRFLINPFDEFPSTYLNIPMQNIVLSLSTDNGNNFQNHFIEPVPIVVLRKALFEYDNGYIYFVQSSSSMIYCVRILADGTITTIDDIDLSPISNSIVLKKAFIYNDNIYFLANDFFNEYIFYHQIGTDNYVLLSTFEKSPASDYILSQDDNVFAYYINYQNQQLHILGYTSPESNEEIHFDPIELNFSLNSHSKLLAEIRNSNGKFVIKTFNPQNNNSSLKYITATISLLNSNSNSVTSAPIVYKSYPNPFNPIAKNGKSNLTILLSLSKLQHIRISIYNLKGQLIKEVFNEKLSAGEHSIVWNGKDNKDYDVSSGIYLYKIETEDQSYLKKFTLIR